MNKRIIFLLSFSLVLFGSFARDIAQTDSLTTTQTDIKPKEQTANTTKTFLKVSGYAQAEYQWGEPEANLIVGTANENIQKPFSRIGLRRGFIKAIYGNNIVSGTFAINVGDRGIIIQEAFFSIKSPWTGASNIKLGIFDRPFGYEISYSSSLRESPERANIIRMLFPEERDLGAMLTLKADDKSPLSIFKLEAGLFAGNGIKPETDNHKDFIGHLSAAKKWSKISLLGGISYYNGGVYQGTKDVYTMQDKSFVVNSKDENIGKFAKRQYLGFDAQLIIKNILGSTLIRGEYIQGVQPSKKGSTQSPNASTLPSYDTYIRNFNGGYIIVSQSIGKLPVSVVFKYDWYDPNTNITINDIGLNNTNESDILRDTFGIGMLWDVNKSIRLQAYFDINRNEKTQNLAGYNVDKKDNVLTCRIQYKF